MTLQGDRRIRCSLEPANLHLSTLGRQSIRRQAAHERLRAETRGSLARMGLFSRKPKDAKQVCRECGQLNDPDAVECDMCGAELRHDQPEERLAPRATPSR